MTLLSCSSQGLLPIPNANKYTQQATYIKRLGSEIKKDIKEIEWLQTNSWPKIVYFEALGQYYNAMETAKGLHLSKERKLPYIRPYPINQYNYDVKIA